MRQHSFLPLSIVTINLNNREGLFRTLNSIICQTFHEFEWIVIDGGSTDGSRELIEKYAEHIAYWVSEPDMGIYNAMNKGVIASNGEYCLFLNSGDCLYKVSTLEEVFANKHYSEIIIWGRILYPLSNDLYIETGFKDKNFSAFELFRCSLPHQASFIRRDYLVENGCYDESYKSVSDLKFFYDSIIMKRVDCACLDMIVTKMEGNGISSDLDKSKLEEDQLFCEFYPSRLLKDYHEWGKLRDENNDFKRKMKQYHNTIALYDSIKQYTLLRKLHTLCYKLFCKR